MPQLLSRTDAALSPSGHQGMLRIVQVSWVKEEVDEINNAYQQQHNQTDYPHHSQQHYPAIPVHHKPNEPTQEANRVCGCQDDLEGFHGVGDGGMP